LGDTIRRSDQQLKTMIQSLEQNKPTLCTYNIGNYHWIIFAAIKDMKNKITVLYKDSQGRSNPTLQAKLQKINPTTTFQAHEGIEQTRGVDCGIFALENMKIMADQLISDRENFVRSFPKYDKFCSFVNAQALRKGAFANFFDDESKTQEQLANLDRAQRVGIRHHHQIEIKQIIHSLDDPCITIELSIPSDSLKSGYNYAYSFSFNSTEDDDSVLKKIESHLGVHISDCAVREQILKNGIRQKIILIPEQKVVGIHKQQKLDLSSVVVLSSSSNTTPPSTTTTTTSTTSITSLIHRYANPFNNNPSSGIFRYIDPKVNECLTSCVVYGTHYSRIIRRRLQK